MDRPIQREVGGGLGEYIVNRMSEVPFGWNVSSPGFTVKNITVNRLS